jgi:ABC-type nitrate/sulfonate/bicarbonate transport system substrate-binding protein
LEPDMLQYSATRKMKVQVIRTVCFFLGVLVLADTGWCQRPIPVRLAYSSPTITNAPIWIGAELGVFKKYGAETELTFIASSTTLTQAMLGGQIHL